MYYWLFYYICNGCVTEKRFPLTLYSIEDAFKYIDSVTEETGRYVYIGMVNEKGVKVR